MEREDYQAQRFLVEYQGGIIPSEVGDGSVAQADAGEWEGDDVWEGDDEVEALDVEGMTELGGMLPWPSGVEVAMLSVVDRTTEGTSIDRERSEAAASATHLTEPACCSPGVRGPRLLLLTGRDPEQIVQP